MYNHLLIPGVSLTKGSLHPAYEDYMLEWREDAIRRADAGDTAASTCLQATMIDLVLFGAPNQDWVGVMDEHLVENGRPLAYSAAFSRRLHGFGDQYLQSTIGAIHSRWWVESLTQSAQIDPQHYASLVLLKKQTDGLLYDREVSPTLLRHRMKTELTMSMAMGVEILAAAHLLTDSLALELGTNVAAPQKCPLLGYISMEYFRMVALRLLRHDELFPAGIDLCIEDCAEGLSVGWCDFPMKSKFDAYMGTPKRTARDKPIHSPLVACYAKALLAVVEDEDKKMAAFDRLSSYSCHLRESPLDVPAFQMRDIPIPFGADITPIEAICASHLISECTAN